MMTQIGLVTGTFLILIGFYTILTDRNLIKMVIGFSIADTGIHIVIVSFGYLTGRTAPILDKAELLSNTVAKVVDPVPQALVLTAIVIGFGITALMLVFVMRLYQKNGTLDISKYGEQK